jgi:protease I
MASRLIERYSMSAPLEGKRVAALVTHGFEESELFEPTAALERAGAQVDVVAPEAGEVRGWTNKAWGENVRVHRSLDRARPEEYDAVLLPGGVMSPDVLRTNPIAISFVRAAFNAGKPIAAICHGPWTLIEAGLVDGLRMTSWPSLRTDLINAGAEWMDADVVVDRGIVTSRQPADLPKFIEKMIAEFTQGASRATRPLPGARRLAGAAPFGTKD